MLQRNMKQIKHNILRIPTGGRQTSWLFGYLQSVEEMSSGLPKTNPASSREEDLNPGPPDYKSSALTTRPRRHFLFGLLRVDLSLVADYLNSPSLGIVITKYQCVLYFSLYFEMQA